MGKKDIIKIDRDIDLDLDILGYLDPNITVNIIKDDVRVEKYHVELPGNVLYIGTSPDYQLLFDQMIQELQLCRPQYEELISLQLRNIFILISRSIMSATKFSRNLSSQYYSLPSAFSRVIITHFPGRII